MVHLSVVNAWHLMLKTIYCRWEKHANRRYYQLIVNKDLFDKWIVTKIWGGIERRTGRIVHVPCASLAKVIEVVFDTISLRKKHGYQLLFIRTGKEHNLLQHSLMTGPSVALQ